MHKVVKNLERSLILSLSYNCSLSSLSYIKQTPLQNQIILPLSSLFTQTVLSQPSSPLIHSYRQNKSLSYKQVYDLSISLATGMIKQFGLKQGDRVGIYSYNKWEWVVVQIATAMAGAVLVNVNPAYQATELEYTISKVGLKVLFLSDSFKHSNYISIIKKIIPQIQTTHNQRDLSCKKFPFLKGVVRFNQQFEREKGFINFSQLLVQSDPSVLPSAPSPFAATNIQFTSGTTGLPKAAVLSHHNILNNGYQIGNRLNFSSNDNIVLPVPFYHCFGMVMGTVAAITRGAGITIVGEGFDPTTSLEAVTKYKATAIYGVPTMFLEYLRVLEEAKQGTYDLSHLKRGIIAGALANQTLMNKIINKLGIKQMTNCYGMTQTSPVSFQTSPSDSMIKKTTTVGRSLDGIQSKIVNDAGQTLPIGVAGQFWTKGWHIMLQYWHDPLATSSSIQDGWMKSGDMGIIDKQGYLSIVGRKKDMIIRGGQNIYPKEIQQYLIKFQGVQDVQVVGVKDQKFGEEVLAILRVKSVKENRVTAHMVYNHCRGNIAHYKIPKYVKFVEALPLTVTGKPQKFILKKEFQEQITKGQHTKYIIR